MTTQLRKRIKRVEAEVVAPTSRQRCIVLLFEPTRREAKEQWAEFQANLEKAKSEAKEVVVVSFLRTKREVGPGNVTFEPFNIDSIGAIMARARGEPGATARGSSGALGLDPASQLVGPVLQVDRDGDDVEAPAWDVEDDEE